MKFLEGAVRRRWWIGNAPGTREGMGISGLDWGGEAPVALLHHANGFCAATLAPLARRLQLHYRVIAIDARGQGDSDRPLLPEGARWACFADDLAAVARQILDETGHERIAYGIGSSFGGTASAVAEALHPGTFERIAMLDPPVHFGEAWMREAGLDPDEIRRPGPTLVELAKRRRAVWPSREAAREAWREKPAFLSWTREAFDLYIDEGFRDLPDGRVELKCSPEMEAAVFEASDGDIGLFATVSPVACPTLLAHALGGHFPAKLHEHFVAHLPNGVLQAVHAGHLMPCEDPDLCAQLLFDFANQQPSTDSSTASMATPASIP